jgi:peptidyl-prolyl cis-trans isomerase C
MRERARVGYLRLVASAALVAGCVGGHPSENGLAAEQGGAEARTVVARVNGEPIYEDQLQPAVEKNLAQFARHGARADDPKLIKRLQTRHLNELIGNLLVYQESRKQVVENLDEKVEQRLKEMEEEQRARLGVSSHAETSEMAADARRESVEARIRIDEYLKEQGVLEPEIPEERIRAMYDEDPESFSTIETVRVSHVLIAVEGQAGAEEKRQARQKAEQIREEILAGGDFSAIAKAHSDCKTAPLGGDLGHIKRGYMPAAFDEVAFSLETDTVSEVVETRFGYHVIVVVEREPARVVSYEQMRGFLETYLQGEESKRRLAAHIAELRERSEIEILLNDLQ